MKFAVRHVAAVSVIGAAILWIQPIEGAWSQTRNSKASCGTVAGIDFVQVPAGPFKMGRQFSAPGYESKYADELPAHDQQIRSFCIAKRALSGDDLSRIAQAIPGGVLRTEVITPADAAAALNQLTFDNLPSQGPRFVQALRQFQRESHIPVSGQLDSVTKTALEARTATKLSDLSNGEMNWFQAKALANALSAPTYRLRLPTEVEWERAARGGFLAKLTPWGNPSESYDGRSVASLVSELRKDSCNFEDKPKLIVPANEYGLEGLMQGWEWTSTIYAPYPYRISDGRERQEPSAGPRVIRGDVGGQEVCNSHDDAPPTSVALRGYGEVTSAYRVRLVWQP